MKSLQTEETTKKDLHNIAELGYSVDRLMRYKGGNYFYGKEKIQAWAAAEAAHCHRAGHHRAGSGGCDGHLLIWNASRREPALHDAADCYDSFP